MTIPAWTGREAGCILNSLDVPVHPNAHTPLRSHLHLQPSGNFCIPFCLTLISAFLCFTVVLLCCTVPYHAVMKCDFTRSALPFLCCAVLSNAVFYLRIDDGGIVAVLSFVCFSDRNYTILWWAIWSHAITIWESWKLYNSNSDSVNHPQCWKYTFSVEKVE